jgi:formiminoglutamase
VATKWTETLEKLGQNAFISFDIDSIQGSDCPGVSAPANFGISAEEACKMSMMAGESARVKLFDMSELNPLIEDYRTPRLAVLMFYFFAMGVARRKAAPRK